MRQCVLDGLGTTTTTTTTTGVGEKLGGHARGIRLEDSAQSSFSFSCFPLALDGSKKIRNETLF